MLVKTQKLRIITIVAKEQLGKIIVDKINHFLVGYGIKYNQTNSVFFIEMIRYFNYVAVKYILESDTLGCTHL